MTEERKKEDVVKCINGELYYLGDYANFLYEKLDEKDKEIEKLHSIIKEAREYIKKYRTMVDGYEDKDTGQIVYEHRLKLNKHQVRELLEILDKAKEK